MNIVVAAGDGQGWGVPGWPHGGEFSRELLTAMAQTQASGELTRDGKSA
jgi:hypothetical protein